MWRSGLLAAMFLAICAPRLSAQELPIMPVEITSRYASCMAVSDQHRILVVGDYDAQSSDLTVYRLGDNGEPIAGEEPQRITLPKPDALSMFDNRPLGLAFHPALPLLYVWQDITGPQNPDEQQRTAILAGFDHLVIFSIENGKLTELGATARGPQFSYFQGSGRVAIAPSTKRLFLSNLRDINNPTSNQAFVGFYELDEQGLPRPTAVPVEGEFDAYGLPKTQPLMRATGTPVNADPSYGFVVISDTMVLFGMQYGLAVWDAAQVRPAINQVQVPGPGYYYNVISHPTLPLIYGASAGSETIFCIEHADGIPTLMPRMKRISGTHFASSPVFITDGPPRLAVGGDSNVVYLVELDERGNFTGSSKEIRVGGTGGQVSAIAWSPQFKRLYVPVRPIP